MNLCGRFCICSRWQMSRLCPSRTSLFSSEFSHSFVVSLIFPLYPLYPLWQILVDVADASCLLSTLAGASPPPAPPQRPSSSSADESSPWRTSQVSSVLQMRRCRDGAHLACQQELLQAGRGKFHQQKQKTTERKRTTDQSRGRTTRSALKWDTRPSGG